MDEKTIEEILNNIIDLGKRDYQDEVLIGNLHLKAIMNLWENYQNQKRMINDLIEEDLECEKEVDKLKRMVEIMAEHLTTDTHGKDWVIKYFEDEVELENGDHK